MTETRAVDASRQRVEEPPTAPSDPEMLTGDETVDEVLTQHPGLRLAMMSYGLCTCCSGNLTLKRTVAVRGIPLVVVLADLRRELAKGA